MSEDERVAVITGGAGAIGTEIAARLAGEGMRTVIVDRRDGDVCVDLSSETETRSAAAEILRRFGRVDVLVHSAAVFVPMPLEGLDIARWRELMAVNLEAPLLLAQAFAPGMRERRFGRIVLIASDTAWSPPGAPFLPYVASKAATLGVVRTLAVDLGRDGIAVTGVAPGLTDTPIARRVNDDAQLQAVVDAQVMKRPLTPADTAATVAFLVSDAGEALSGQTVVVNGGITMR